MPVPALSTVRERTSVRSYLSDLRHVGRKKSCWVQTPAEISLLMIFQNLPARKPLFKVRHYSTVCSRAVYWRYTVALPRVTVQPR
jgi:hypothetical protein